MVTMCVAWPREPMSVHAMPVLLVPVRLGVDGPHSGRFSVGSMAAIMQAV
jgi:hypothetical protein